MKSPTGLFEATKNHLFNKYSNNLSQMLLVTGTLSWIFSAAAQIFGIATNDKVPVEKKKFLIPQEIADAAINILSFYFVTRSIQTVTKKLVSSGKIITPAISKFCQENGIKIAKDESGKPNIGKAILDRISEYKAVINKNKSENLNINKAKTDKLQIKIDNFNDFYDTKYAIFETGFGIIGNVIGAVLSSNIITPLLRNPIAAAKQRQSIAQENMQKQQQLNTVSPVISVQNKLLMDAYKSKVGITI